MKTYYFNGFCPDYTTADQYFDLRGGTLIERFQMDRPVQQDVHDEKIKGNHCISVDIVIDEKGERVCWVAVDYAYRTDMFPPQNNIPTDDELDVMLTKALV